MSLGEIREMFDQWEKKEFLGRYFEMFAIIKDEKIVGMISLYQLSDSMISCGPEIFMPYRKQGIGTEAMVLAMNIAKDRGYKVVLQQISLDNIASIALHNKLSFETDGYTYKNKKEHNVRVYIKLL